MLSELSSNLSNTEKETAAEWEARREGAESELKASLLAAGLDLSKWNEPDHVTASAAAASAIEGAGGEAPTGAQKLLLQGLHLAGVDITTLEPKALQQILAGAGMVSRRGGNVTASGRNGGDDAEMEVDEEEKKNGDNKGGGKEEGEGEEEDEEAARAKLLAEKQKREAERQERLQWAKNHTSEKVVGGDGAGGRVGGSVMMVKPTL